MDLHNQVKLGLLKLGKNEIDKNKTTVIEEKKDRK